MITIGIDDRQLRQNLRDLADKDVRTAASWALNDLAVDVRDHMHSRMDLVFDRPTRFTKNAIPVLRGARPNRLEAEVGERPSVGGRHYLKVQERGGGRGMTGVEGLLSLNLPSELDIRAAIPATGSPFEAAKLDAHGNWSTGERNQVLSALRAQRDATSNQTDKSKKRKSKRATYFAPKHGLAPGVYRRRGADDIPVRVLKFSSKVPQYRKRLGFYDGAEEIWRKNLPHHLRRTLAKVAARRPGRG